MNDAAPVSDAVNILSWVWPLLSGLITAVGAAFLVGWRAKAREEKMTTAITSLETGVVGKIQRLREDLSGSIAELRTQVAVIDQHRQTGSLETVALRSEMAAMQHEVGDIAKSVVKLQAERDTEREIRSVPRGGQ